MDVCVIGAGILGLTTAYELTGRGHAVTLLDGEGVCAGASHRSFAWINANNKTPSSYHRINAEGIEEHIRLQAELGPRSGRTWFHQSGNILADFSERRVETYARRAADAEVEGYPVESADAARLSDLEPAIAWPGDLGEALFYPTEGWLDNDVLSDELVHVLRARGVELRLARVTRIDSDADGATAMLEDGSTVAADALVVATGAGSRDLAEASGMAIPVADLSRPSARTHSLLGLTRPVDVPLSRMLVSDRLNVRPRHDGRMWVQLARAEHRVSEGESQELLAEVAGEMEAELGWLFGREVPVERVYFSGRSFPEDGRSIIGFLDEPRRIYCTVTHSGMTLAALFGRLAAEELEGGESALLADFRPERFAGGYAPAGFDTFIGKQ